MLAARCSCLLHLLRSSAIAFITAVHLMRPECLEPDGDVSSIWKTLMELSSNQVKSNGITDFSGHCLIAARSGSLLDARSQCPLQMKDLKGSSGRPGVFICSLIQHVLLCSVSPTWPLWFLNHGPVMYWRWQADLSRQAKSLCVYGL